MRLRLRLITGYQFRIIQAKMRILQFQGQFANLSQELIYSGPESIVLLCIGKRQRMIICTGLSLLHQTVEVSFLGCPLNFINFSRPKDTPRRGFHDNLPKLTPKKLKRQLDIITAGPESNSGPKRMMEGIVGFRESRPVDPHRP